MSGVLEALRESRDALLAAAAAQGLSDLRVFGSVARGDETSESDVDLLVHPSAESSIFDLAGFMAEVEEMLGTRVDVVSDRGTGGAMERIVAEAIPL
jgi:predicted nucleotidyltransferase